MGKRLRRRHAKRLKDKNVFEEDTEIKFFLTTLEPCSIELNSDQDKLVRKVKDCISEIYNEHIIDLEQRKVKRLQLKVPTDYFQPYNLVVNSTYQQKIKSYIKELIKANLAEGFKSDLICTTDVFIDYLSKHVKEFKGKKSLLQIIILYEAYHTLQNSITQIGGIIEDVISRRDFDMILKEKFYCKIAAEYLDIVENIVNKESTHYIDDLLRMRKTLENIGKYDCDKDTWIDYGSTLYSESCSEEDPASEALHNLPIEELVKIINDQSNRRKKAKLKKKGRTIESEADQVDFDVEEFRKRLDDMVCLEDKGKPLVSKEFLDGLRDRIRNCNESRSN